MNKIANFGETQNVEVTILVDNRADFIVKSSENVQRFTGEPLLAEHGFAALIDLKEAGVRILWDAGATRIAFPENVKRLKLDMTTINKIALSHGHFDHIAALTDAIKAIVGRPARRKWDKDATMEEIQQWVQPRRVPLIVHPAAFRERWGLGKDGARHGPGLPPPRAEWEAVGAELILCEGPFQLGPGCWTTGAVPRLSFEQAGTPAFAHYRQGDVFERDYLDDDQAIVINVKGKGLVVVAGCAHSGIVNTLNYARKISGESRVWAVLGGFHLSPAKDDEIQRTIDAVKEMNPTLIAPSHCTGFKAISQFAQQMPVQFVLGVVGTSYRF